MQSTVLTATDTDMIMLGENTKCLMPWSLRASLLSCKAITNLLCLLYSQDPMLIDTIVSLETLMALMLSWFIQIRRHIPSILLPTKVSESKFTLLINSFRKLR